MGQFIVFTIRLASLLVLHAVGAGFAMPTVLVSRPVDRVALEWLPIDNQTLYRLSEGETRSLELNTSSLAQQLVYITISPCSRDFHWALYRGKSGNNGQLSIQRESSSGDIIAFSLNISRHDKYVLVLSSVRGGSSVVSVRGEVTRQVRMRLRVRSRRRLAANWEPSPIDPQTTTYCVVASNRKNYTSMCSAQQDIKTNRIDNPNRAVLGSNSDNNTRLYSSAEIDNTINIEDTFSIYEGNFNNVFKRKKFGRSTRVTDEDPVIACVGGRTHHLIENLDPSTTYFVSLFGVAKDRRFGSLLATGRVRPRTSTARRLRENVPNKTEIRGKNVFYFKGTFEDGEGLWLSVSTCGGAVDVEVLVRGKRLQLTRNIHPHSKFFVPAPMVQSSIQETSDESSIQFDSNSEEAKVRYVIKVTPSRLDRDNAVAVKLTASTTRWGVNTPELTDANVRELKPKRSCHTIDVAFLPATHNSTDVIRYCTVAREIVYGEAYTCWPSRKSSSKGHCIDHTQISIEVHVSNATNLAGAGAGQWKNSHRQGAEPLPAPVPVPVPCRNVIVQRLIDLKAGRKYAIQVTAAVNGSSVAYNTLYADTNVLCKEE